MHPLCASTWSHLSSAGWTQESLLVRIPVLSWSLLEFSVVPIAAVCVCVCTQDDQTNKCPGKGQEKPHGGTIMGAEDVCIQDLKESWAWNQ